jgi:hypothetical protein
MGVMEQGTFGINCDLIPSLSLYKNQRTKSEKTDSDLGLCSLMKPSRVLNPACIQNKGHSIISVLIVQMVLYIGLCVGVHKKYYYDQWNCWIWCSEFIFLTYIKCVLNRYGVLCKGY